MRYRNLEEAERIGKAWLREMREALRPMKAITEFSLQDHGVENASYWQGAGVAFTEWSDAFTGVGDTPREAADDALEMAAQAGEWDGCDFGAPRFELALNRFSEKSEIPEHAGDCDGCLHGPHDVILDEPCEGECMEGSELQHYVVLYVR